MPQSYAAWRATYTPGSWVVLAGPSSLVLLQPAPATMSTLLTSIWDAVVEAASVHDLVGILSSTGLDQIPHLGLFFWDGQGMHSLVRGQVRVIDPRTNELVNTGEGVVTWSERGVPNRLVRVDLEPVDPQAVLQLPLMVGAVTASSVVLDATATGQGLFGGVPAVVAEGSEAVDQASSAPSAPELPESAESAPEQGSVEPVELVAEAVEEVAPEAQVEDPQIADAQPEVLNPDTQFEQPQLTEPQVESPQQGESPVAPQSASQPFGAAGGAVVPPSVVPAPAQPDWQQPAAAAAGAAAAGIAGAGVAGAVAGQPGFPGAPQQWQGHPGQPPVPPQQYQDQQAQNQQAQNPQAQNQQNWQQGQPETQPWQGQQWQPQGQPSAPAWQGQPSAEPWAPPAPVEQYQAAPGQQAQPMGQPSAERRPEDGLVMASICAFGHPNPPGSHHCRICPAPVNGGVQQWVSRPALAILRVSSGEVLDLVGPVVIGRAPSAAPNEPSLTTVKVPSPSSDISRNHLRVVPDGWTIVATDLHSTNGTLVHRRGEGPIRLNPGEGLAIALGDILDLGDGISIEVAPPA